jgi:tryptophanase
VVAELGQPCFRVAHYRELFPGFFAEGAPARLPGAEGVAARRARLDGPGSLVALAPEHVTLDLLTDSHEAEISDGGPEAPESAVIAGLTELYPFPHIELAPRGRVAEAWLVDALIPPGSTVLVNALFPTAWHHLHGRGARLLRVDRAGELDLDRILAGLDEPGVAALWLELAPNASAGRPLPVELLEEVAAAARKRGVPLVLDACRLFTNAVALADAHASQMAAALCACGDACTAGLAKEVAAPLGGIVATRSAPLAERVRFVARRMYGHGLGPSARGRLLRPDPGGLHPAPSRHASPAPGAGGRPARRARGLGGAHGAGVRRNGDTNGR